MHKLKLHWLRVKEMEGRVRGTSSRDHNRFNGFNEKLNKLNMDFKVGHSLSLTGNEKLRKRLVARRSFLTFRFSIKI